MKWNETTIPNHKSRKQIERDSSRIFLGHVKMHLAVVRKKTWKTFALHIVLHFSNCQLPAKRAREQRKKERQRETNWAGTGKVWGGYKYVFSFYCCVLLKIAKSLLPSCSCSPGKCAWNLSSARRAPGNQPRKRTEETSPDPARRVYERDLNVFLGTFVSYSSLFRARLGVVGIQCNLKREYA